MRKTSLEKPLTVAYSTVDETVLGIKSCVINLCSDIERYFDLKLWLNISNPIQEYQYPRVKREYPYLANLTLEQFNRFLTIFKCIRDINAHLYLKRPVFIDDDITDYLTKIIKPDYIIKIDNKLTVYGQVYVLLFLAHKYNIFPFLTTFFTYKYFVEMSNFNGKELNSFHVRTQHRIQKLCGIGKPIYPKVCCLEKREYQYLNETFKKSLSRIIYSIEMSCSNNQQASNNVESISELLEGSSLAGDLEVQELIIFLRNCWLHGNYLDEEVDNYDEKVILNYQFIFNTFNTIKRHLIDKEEFVIVIDEINKFVNSCFNYYLLRLIEVSYKVLDNRLMLEEKLDSRVDNLMFAFERFNDANSDFYELIGKLIEPSSLTFKVGGGRFLDFITRVTECDKSIIIKFHSENGFEIGNYHTNATELVVAKIDLEREYTNKINGKYLDEYKLTNETRYGCKISVFDAVF